MQLSELGGIPLLLSVMIYLRLTGRVLPHRRLAALDELVKALLEDQPRRRAQAAMQRADQSVIRSPRIRRGIEYLAYRIHQEPNSIVLTNERAMDLLRDYFRSNLELTPSEAEEWATRVLELGQHEFGVLVAPQEHHVGLVHRIFQEYLAAKYLARLPLDRVRNYCVETGCKSPWHEVTLTLMQLLERECRELVFGELQKITEADTRIALTKLLAPSLRNDPAFRAWTSGQLRCVHEDSSIICPLAFDVIANAVRPVEFALLEAALTRY